MRLFILTLLSIVIFTTYIVLVQIDKVLVHLYQPANRHNLEVARCVGLISKIHSGSIVNLSTKIRNSQNYYQIVVNVPNDGIAMYDCFPNSNELTNYTPLDVSNFHIILGV